MLDVTRTRDKKTAYFVFTLELMLSLTPATYQLGARDVGNEKMSATKTQLHLKEIEREKNMLIREQRKHMRDVSNE